MYIIYFLSNVHTIVKLWIAGTDADIYHGGNAALFSWTMHWHVINIDMKNIDKSADNIFPYSITLHWITEEN